MFKPYRFRLRFVTDNEGGGGPKPGSEDLGFPADTKPEDMTAEEQLAFYKYDAQKWKGLSRKHEKNRKPENFDELAADAQKWRDKADEDLEPDEKAVKAAAKDARKQGFSEGVSSLLQTAVRAEFKARAPHLSDEELTEFLEDIDVTPERFYVDDEINTERIDRLARRIVAPVEGDDEEGDDKLPKISLGNVLNRGNRKHNQAQGVDYYRQQEAERYAKQTNPK